MTGHTLMRHKSSISENGFPATMTFDEEQIRCSRVLKHTALDPGSTEQMDANNVLIPLCCLSGPSSSWPWTWSVFSEGKGKGCICSTLAFSPSQFCKARLPEIPMDCLSLSLCENVSPSHEISNLHVHPQHTEVCTI